MHTCFDDLNDDDICLFHLKWYCTSIASTSSDYIGMAKIRAYVRVSPGTVINSL